MTDDETFITGNVIGYLGVAGDLAATPIWVWLPIYLVGLFMALSVVWRGYWAWVKAVMEAQA